MTPTRFLVVPTTILFFMVASLIVPQKVKADNQACNFGNGIEELKKIQANSGEDSPARVVAELNIRKGLLKTSVDCLKQQSNDLDAQLEKLKSAAPEVKAFSKWLHGQIQESISFYEYKETQIDNLGLKGAKDFAKELADRKVQKDDPLEDLALSLLDWDTSQILFENGSKRFSDIKKTLGAFELPANHEIVLLQKEATTIFNEASAKNQNAWKDLASRQTDAAKVANKESLESLAEAYTVFLKISDVSKKTLPL